MEHGGNRYQAGRKIGVSEDALIDFSANICPLGMPDPVREAAAAAAAAAVHYPDPSSSALCEQIARSMTDEGYDIRPQWVMCGSGAADLIYRLVFAMNPRTAVVPHPTFGEYEEAMGCIGTKIIGYDLNHDGFEIKEDILENINETVDMVFICSPNNPTGVLTERALLEAIVERTARVGALAVIDECFLDFVPEPRQYTMAGHLTDYPNMLILRSFTKMYAMPGLRLGYALCGDETILDQMKRFGPPWPVSTAAQAAGMAAILAKDHRKKTVDYIFRERTWMEQALASMGIEFTQSSANYILIRVPEVSDLYEQMLLRRIMIRRCENYVNLDGSYFRIAVGCHEDNVQLMAALKQIIGEKRRLKER